MNMLEQRVCKTDRGKREDQIDGWIGWLGVGKWREISGRG